MAISLPFQFLLLGVHSIQQGISIAALVAIWPNPLAESRPLWSDKVSDRGTRRSLQGSGEPARFAANNIQLYARKFCSMLSYTGNVLGITACFYSYLQGIFANKTRPLLAPVCITACLVAGEISGQTANQRAFAHIDHKHSVNIGKSVKEMGNILKMTSAFLCSSSGAICKTAVWNSCSGFTTIFANSGSLD